MTVERIAQSPAGTGPVGQPVDAAGPEMAGSTWPRPAMAWYGVSMIALVTLFGQLDRGIMALLLASIKRDTGMSDTELSLLMGLAFSIPYMFVGLPVARMADVGRRTVILPAALAVWSLGTALCGMAQSFWQFFVFRALIGAGESIKGPTSTSLIPDLVPRTRLSRAFGVYNVAVGAGESLALILGGLLLGIFVAMPPIHVPMIGELHGWRMVYLVFGIPGLLLAIVFLLTVKEPARHGLTRPGSAPIRDVALFLVRGPAARVYVPLLCAAVLNSLYLMGIGAWRPTFYERTYGLGPAEYGPIIGLGMLIAAPVGVALGAFVVERLARSWDDAHLRLVLLTELLTIPVVILAPLMPSFTLALACQVMLNILLMMSAPSRLAAMQIITPNEMRAQANAIFMFLFGAIGAGLGPSVIALVTDFIFKDEAELRYAMLTTAAIAAPVVAICTLTALRPYGRLYRSIIDRERAGAD